MSWWNPAVIAPSSGGDEDVDVGVKRHRARPGVQHGEQPEPRAELPWIRGKSLERARGGGEQGVVDLFWMTSGQGAQFSREREGDEEIGTLQQSLALPLEPTAGLLAVTLGTVSVAARVIAVAFAAAAIAAEAMSAEGGGTAAEEVSHDATLVARQSLEPRCTGLAEDLRQLEHDQIRGRASSG